jgi:Fe-S-cluster containining protein
VSGALLRLLVRADDAGSRHPHESDGQCSHLDRKTHGCTIYQQRPAACRGFDCRGDSRIWLDFEKRIIAPLP